MTQMLLNYAVSHQQFFVGAATGYALAHIPDATLFAFHQAMRVPWFRAAILSNPEQAKKVLRQIESELEKDIDAEAATAKTAEVTKAQEPPKL